MLRVSCNGNMHGFMYGRFPRLVRAYLREKVGSLPRYRRAHVDKLLSDEFKVRGGLAELVDLFCDNLKVNNDSDRDYYIYLGDAYVNGVSVEAIVRTVDYGNSTFPPLGLFKQSLLFLANNIWSIYKYSQLGVN